MEIAFHLVLLAVAVLGVTAVAGQIDVPAPLLLIARRASAPASCRSSREVHLGQEVVLLGLLPPLLYAAALQTSLVDFNANRRAILLLSVGLVLFTTAGVGVRRALDDPGVSWAAGPRDRRGGRAAGRGRPPPPSRRRIGLPRRIVTILEGESLLNDATALVALRTAARRRRVGSVTVLEVGLDFVVAAGGGVLVGLLAFVVVGWTRKRVTDPLLDTAMSLVTPFAAYIVAEEIHASGVLAVVIAGLLLGHKAPILQTAQSRIAERMNWRTIAYVLENTVFLLIGLQADWIIRDVADSDLGRTADRRRLRGVAGRGVVLRMLWVFPARYLLVRPGPGRPHRSAYAVDVHVRARLGRDARRGDAGRGVPDPRGHRAPRGAAADRLHRGGRHAVRPGADAAVGGPHPQGARRRTRAEDALARATLLHQASRGRARGARRARRARTRSACGTRSATGSTGATSRPGSSSATAPPTTRRPARPTPGSGWR